MFVTAIIIGFSRSWRLALVMLSTTVAGTFAMGFNGRNMRVNQDKAVEEYALAGTLAEEVISSARDVAAFGTQKRLESKYNVFLEKASQFDYKAKMFLSIMIATLMGILNLQFALAFFAGNKFFHNGDIGVAQILTVLMSAMIAGMSIGRMFNILSGDICAKLLQTLFPILDHSARRSLPLPRSSIPLNAILRLTPKPMTGRNRRTSLETLNSRMSDMYTLPGLMSLFWKISHFRYRLER